LETVHASSEPLAYRKVREKHPNADSILLLEVRREGDRVDRSRRDRNSGQILNSPLGNRRASLDRGSRKRNSIFPLVNRTVSSGPELPFGKLIDQMHKQNIQDIVRGKTFQESNMRIQQALIELQQRRLAAARAKQQVSSGGSGNPGKSGKSGNSEESSGKQRYRKGDTKSGQKERIGGRVRPGGKKNGGSGSTGGGKKGRTGEGDSGVRQGSGIPVSPNF